MTVAKLTALLRRNFTYWRVFEGRGGVLIKIADGPISTDQMYLIHENRPVGIPIHFDTYGWFMRQLFKHKLIKNRVTKWVD